MERKRLKGEREKEEVCNGNEDVSAERAGLIICGMVEEEESGERERRERG